MINVRQLAGALDLWLCMWEPDERERFETAVVRAMNDANPMATRLQALALCHVVDTPRLRTAAERVAQAGLLAEADVAALSVATRPWRELVAAGRKLRGNVLAVERLLTRAVADAKDRSVDATLDWVDIRDLVAVARTTLDGRLFGEIERRIARRGNYQRGRAANVLGFRAQPAPTEVAA